MATTMAVAETEPRSTSTSPAKRFWCHACTHHVDTRDDDASGELCCVACGGNFVEEVEADDPPDQFLAVAASSGAEAPGTNNNGANITTDSASTRESLDRASAVVERARAAIANAQMPPSPPLTLPTRTRIVREGGMPSPLTELLQQLVGGAATAGGVAANDGGGAGGAGGRTTTRTARIVRSNGAPVEFYVTSMSDAGVGDFGDGLFGLLGGLAGDGGRGGGGGGFATNPGDYALGPNHLSHLINQLMQNDPNRHGAPPTAKDVLDKLPKRKIEQPEVDANSECAVCKDLFAVDDVVHDLPCTHSFHPDCIVPWLKMHNSCPVCRAELPTDDREYDARRRDEQQQHHQFF